MVGIQANEPMMASVGTLSLDGVLSYEDSKTHLYTVEEFAETFAQKLGMAYGLNDIREVNC